MNRHIPSLLLASALAALPGGGVFTLGAQELLAPVPSFELLGSVTPKITWSGTAWDSKPASTWAFTTALKPEFTDGPFFFVADTTWTLPLTANLTSVAPTVAIPEAYARFTITDSLDVTFGQKHYPLGVGQTLTVGDSINPVIGFFDQKTGFRGITAEWSPVSWASVSAAASTESGFLDDWTGAGQLSLLTGGLQATASVVARDSKTLRPAAGVSYDLFGLILTAEGAAEFLPQQVRPVGDWGSLTSTGVWAAPTAWSSPAYSGSLGARYALSLGDFDLTVSAEALHAGESWTVEETTTWKEALNKASLANQVAVRGGLAGLRASLPLRSQNNAFFRVNLGYAGEVSASGFAAVDLQDHSTLFQTTLGTTLYDNLDLLLTGQAATGDPGDSWEFVSTDKSRFQVSFSTTYHF